MTLREVRKYRCLRTLFCLLSICYTIPQRKYRFDYGRVMKDEKIIMKSSEEYMQNLKQWLQDMADSPLEEMSGFFAKRLYDYEEHMLIWEKSYQTFAESLPLDCKKILDLGCGTGLELDKIWQRNLNIEVTAVDLCADMLDKLLEKHGDKHLTTVCQDYFRYDFEYGKWDAVISFESLHHFLPEHKKKLYRKVCNSLKKGGVFLLGDYIACCKEEEELLHSVYLKKRKQSAIPENCKTSDL